MRTSLQNPRSDLYLPTRARMTVRRGAAGKAMVIFISNIWRRSTEKEEIREMDFWKILSFYCVMNLILEHDHRMLMQDLRGWLEPTYKDKNLVVRVPQQHGNGQSLKKKKKKTCDGILHLIQCCIKIFKTHLFMVQVTQKNSSPKNSVVIILLSHMTFLILKNPKISFFF